MAKNKKDLEVEKLVDELFAFIISEIKNGSGENEVIGKVVDKFSFSQREAKRYFEIARSKLLESERKTGKSKVKPKKLFYKLQLQKESVVIVILLTLITYGLYIPAWMWRQREAINSLNTSVKLEKKIFAFWFGCLLLSTLLSFLSGVFEFFPIFNLSLSILASVCAAIYLLGIVVISFMIRKAIDNHFCKKLKWKVNFSKPLTFFFHIFYLQYEINRISEGKYKKR